MLGMLPPSVRCSNTEAFPDMPTRLPSPLLVCGRVGGWGLPPLFLTPSQGSHLIGPLHTGNPSPLDTCGKSVLRPQPLSLSSLISLPALVATLLHAAFPLSLFPFHTTPHPPGLPGPLFLIIPNRSDSHFSYVGTEMLVIAQKGMWKETCGCLNFRGRAQRTCKDYCTDPSTAGAESPSSAPKERRRHPKWFKSQLCHVDAA